ncbi:MAG: amidohydrolase [Deltaproteobacteria bacterium]|nr:amidohydrolase [Deltaproteobacteria bacterium]MBV8453152.1 amidohydrolase [Deltaproteobacteria bacterium]
MRKIDFHCHAFPAEFFETIQHIYPDAIDLKQDEHGRKFALWANTPLPLWDHDARLEDINRAGIDVEILSNPPLYSRVDERTPDLCRLVNDALAASCRRDPDRFKALAHLPFNDRDAALSEMGRALDQLGCVGVLVTSNIAGRYLDLPEFEPFWAEVNRRRTPVFMHPAISPFYHDDQPPTLLSFPFDTTLSAYKLVHANLFEHFPELTLVLAHLGGALPYLARRIDLALDSPGFYGSYPKPRQRPSETMRKLYVDTALGWNRGAFECARELVGLDHIIFGTDYFIRGSNFMERTREFIDGMGLRPADRELIYSGNAARILKLNI